MNYRADSLKDFIRKFRSPNNVSKAVQEDITNKVFLAETPFPCLGIIEKVLTAQLWRIIESKSTIVDLNPELLRLKLDLSCLCKDASTVFEVFRFFGDTETEFYEVGLHSSLENYLQTSMKILMS